ncbi:MAG: DJ-1 family glyoxalase III [Fusobacteriota bacterium]
MKTTIHLAEGFEEVEAISVIDVLRRAKIDLTIVSIEDDLLVKGAHGVEVKADELFEAVNYEEIDMIILPGGAKGTENLGNHEGLSAEIKKFDEKGKVLGAICAAPTVFARLGTLMNENAIAFPGQEDVLMRANANIVDKDVVQSNKKVTSKGPGTALKFGLKLVEIVKGKEAADKVKKDMLIK